MIRFGDNMRDVAVTEAGIDEKLAGYKARYDFVTDDLNSARYQAKEELAIRKVMEREGTRGFIKSFQDLCGMRRLPGLASQNIMADGMEVCPSVAAEKPRVEAHPLGIGGKEPPAWCSRGQPARAALSAG